MIGQRIVAVLAGIVDTATLHLDCNDVQRAVVVSAARLRVEIDSLDARMHVGHGFRETIESWRTIALALFIGSVCTFGSGVLPIHSFREQSPWKVVQRRPVLRTLRIRRVLRTTTAHTDLPRNQAHLK